MPSPGPPPPEIKSPRRILLLSTSEAATTSLLKTLTGSAPTGGEHGLAGASHELRLETAYYGATVPMWIDSVSAGSADAWAAEFSGPEGAEVRGAVGAYVVVVARPGTEVEFAGARAVLRAVGRVVRVAEAEGWDGVCLAVVVREGSEAGDLCVGAEEWEDVGMEMGFEVVDAEEGGGRNEFGEVRGVGRVREGLECNDWEAEGEGEGSDGEGFDWEGEEGVGFGIGPEEMAEEMAGMKRAIYGGAEGSEDEQDEERDVEQMEGLMMKMQAMRDLGADMPEAERKKFAAKAVGDLMKTF